MIGVDGHLKLTDFGLSKQLEDSGTLQGAHTHNARRLVWALRTLNATDRCALCVCAIGTLDGKKSTTTKTICGTPEYIAPEVLQGRAYNSSIDWWTYGCLVYEMVHGSAPFRSLDMGSLVQLITKCKINFKGEFCSSTLEDLLRKVMRVDADERLGAPQSGGASAVKAHSFFGEVDWEALMRKEVPAPCALSEMESKGGGSGRWGAGSGNNSSGSEDGSGGTASQGGSSSKIHRVAKLQKEFATWSGGDHHEEEHAASFTNNSMNNRASVAGSGGGSVLQASGALAIADRARSPAEMSGGSGAGNSQVKWRAGRRRWRAVSDGGCGDGE